MNKKTKKIIAPLLLLLALAAVIVGYILLKSHNDKAAKEEESTDTNSAETLSVADNSKLTMTKLNLGGDLAFSYINDTWQWDKDEKFPLDADQMKEMDDALSLLSAYTKLEAPGELSEYGLDKPTKVISAEYSDGSAYSYSFGAVNDFNGYQYFTYSGEDAVYMVDRALSDTFDRDIKSLFKKESCPIVADSVQADKVISVLIETPTASKEITDEDGIKKIFTPLYAMNLTTWEDYYADAAEMASLYGIGENSTKFTLTYNVTQEQVGEDGKKTSVSVPRKYTVLLGSFFETEDKDDDGNPVNGYFYSTEGSTVVYSVTSDKVDEVLEFLNYVPEETE